MQLFIISDFFIEGGQLFIKNNPELLQQLRKVLRAKIGDQFFIQNPNASARYQVQIDQRSSQDLQTSLVSQIAYEEKEAPIAMAVALPNHTDKLELIIQKLAEIWVSEIFFRPAERSVKKQRNEKKEVRFQRIIKEATEQSRWRKVPKLQFITTLQELKPSYRTIVFDLPEHHQATLSLQKGLEKTTVPLLGVIGPEGGLTINDYAQIGEKYEIVSLWSTVLRLETAAILGARRLKNSWY